MSKEQTSITANEFLESNYYYELNDFENLEINKTIINIMEQYAQAKVLEALEEVKTHIEKQPKLYPLSLWAKLSIMKDEATKQK